MKFSATNFEKIHADDIKKRKLKYAEELCNWIKDNVDVELINLCDKSL